MNNPYNNGFAIMALNCLLVDTFYQFGEYFTETTVWYFYQDIRCGILHSGQTKNGSQLTFDKGYVVERFDEDKIRVDVCKFYKTDEKNLFTLKLLEFAR